VPIQSTSKKREPWQMINDPAVFTNAHICQMKTRFVKHVLCLVVSLGCSAFAYAEEKPTAENALISYQNYLKSIQNVSFHSRFQDRIAEQSDVFTNTLSQDWKVDFEGKRLWRTSNKPVDRAGPAYSEQLITANSVLEISVDPKTLRAQVCTSYLEIPKDYWERRTGFLYLSFPFGYLQTGPEYQYVPAMLKNAVLKEVDASAVELSSKTTEYELSIWLVPSKGWMPQRMEYSRLAPTERADQIRHALYTVDKSSSHDGIWLPDSFHCECVSAARPHRLTPNIRIRDGVRDSAATNDGQGAAVIEEPKMSLVAEVSVSAIKPNCLLDDDFQLQATVPDGLDVWMQDARDLRFVWRDGKIIQRPK
jgi:hypothetical protein